MTTEVSRHKLAGPSAARAQGGAKLEQCRSNCLARGRRAYRDVFTACPASLCRL